MQKVLPIRQEDIEQKIITLRGQKVLLDSDVAKLYGVKTMRINEAVKNNPDKFPAGYVFSLSYKEKDEVIENFDNLKFSPRRPNAFTEKGLYMLATILKGPKAIQTTLAIIETFTKIRELSRTLTALPEATNPQTQKSLMQKSGELFSDVLAEGFQVAGHETSVEINFAILKIKHSIQHKRTT